MCTKHAFIDASYTKVPSPHGIECSNPQVPSIDYATWMDFST